MRKDICLIVPCADLCSGCGPALVSGEVIAGENSFQILARAGTV